MDELVYPFERFSDGAKQVLMLAQEEAERAHHPYIGTEHILLGLLRVPNGVAAVILIGHSVEIETVRTKMAAVDSGKPNIIRQIIPTSRVKKVIEPGFTEARAMGDEEVGTELLLLGLLLEGEGIAAHILRDLGVSLESVRAQLSQMPPRPARRQSESSQRQVSRQPASRGAPFSPTTSRRRWRWPRVAARRPAPSTSCWLSPRWTGPGPERSSSSTGWTASRSRRSLTGRLLPGCPPREEMRGRQPDAALVRHQGEPRPDSSDPNQPVTPRRSMALPGSHRDADRFVIAGCAWRHRLDANDRRGGADRNARLPASCLIQGRKSGL